MQNIHHSINATILLCFVPKMLDVSGELLVFQRIVVRVCKGYGVDLDILHVSLSSLFPEI